MDARERDVTHDASSNVFLDVDQAGMTVPSMIVKRDGRIVPFDIGRIENAMSRCFASFQRTPQTPIPELARRVVNLLVARANGELPTVEGVQDIVEIVLQAAGEFEAAKRYILYRAEQAKKRERRPIPEAVRQAFADSDHYFPTPLQKFQFFDKYSRFNYELGRRETWLETVNRAVDYLYELAGSRLPSETYTRLRQAILELRAMPSMRLLAMAGPAARRNNVTIYNCLSGDECLLTREYGVVPLREVVGPVTLLNQNHEWTDAEVRSFGRQETVEIELGRFKTRKRIRVTMNHNWVLADGSRVTTAELQPGDDIPYMLAPRQVDTQSIDYRLGLIHGIIYGDGTQIFTQERSMGYVIRLCGDSRELLSQFAGYNVSYPPGYGGDPVIYLFDAFAKTHALKALPSDTETSDYLVGFIRGWFAADGYVSKTGQMLFATDDVGENWLRRVGPKVGFDFEYNVMMPTETNFGTRQKKTRNLEIRRQSMTVDDLLLTKHLRNYRQAATDRNWKFLGIIAGTERIEEVYCATVPETHTFTLSDGVLTGNCSYQPVESIDSFVEALIISMSGCGVGFSVESRYVENFPRIKRQTGAMREPFVVADSAEGWAEALHCGLATWFEGGDVRFDLSQLRPAGAPLRTKGGRASGPEPLRAMLDFVRGRILARQGSFLRPIDAHDIMCAVGNAAVSGGVRRCLPAGTRVHTERGAIPIEAVRTGDRVLTAAGYKTVTAWFDQGTQAIVDILTESGTIFRCTPHHRVAVLTDVWGGHTFKYARDLTAEDRLLFITHPIDGEPQELLPLPDTGVAERGSAPVPPTLDTEMAWFMGKFFADGSLQPPDHDACGKDGNAQFAVTCHTSEIEQIERVSAWMERHGVPARIIYQEGSRIQIRSGNCQIARWMSQYWQPHMPPVVPEVIWRGPVEIRAAFVAGLMDGAGCYTDRPVTVVATIYEPFGRDIVRLLATLGIVAEIRLRRPEPEQGGKPEWVVSIKDARALQHAAEMIGTHACRIWIAQKSEQSGYTVPGWMVKRDLPHQQYCRFWSSSRDADLNSATLTTLVEATHYVPVAVVDVRPGGEAHTYDIEVRDGHMFVAEGYLVHNTAMLSLFDYDDVEMRMAKSGDFERDNSQRWNANNSVVWPKGGLTQREFIHQFMEMVDSGRGEPGIFNREAANLLKPARRQAAEFGTNPCGGSFASR